MKQSVNRLNEYLRFILSKAERSVDYMICTINETKMLFPEDEERNHKTLLVPIHIFKRAFGCLSLFHSVGCKLKIIEANIDNKKLSDKDFREFIRNSLPSDEFKDKE